MKTVIKYQGNEYVELNNKAPRMINKKCSNNSCSNILNVPIATIVLGIVDNCSHCNKDYPAKNHCDAITNSYVELIDGEELVEL